VLALLAAFRRPGPKVIIIITAGEVVAPVARGGGADRCGLPLGGSIVNGSAGLLVLSNSAKVLLMPASEKQVRGRSVHLLKGVRKPLRGWIPPIQQGTIQLLTKAARQDCNPDAPCTGGLAPARQARYRSRRAPPTPATRPPESEHRMVSLVFPEGPEPVNRDVAQAWQHVVPGAMAQIPPKTNQLLRRPPARVQGGQ
jgi:hypothetical protein